jgi:hypothetical protein
MEDLQVVEATVRKDPKVIEQCGIIGIPPQDMHKVYCDRKYIPKACKKCLLITLTSLDNWIRRTLWKQRSPSASSDVLPAAPR